MIYRFLFVTVLAMSTDWKNIWKTIREWDGEGRKMALATVVKTWGSSPRPVGSHLVIDADGLSSLFPFFCGTSLSGARVGQVSDTTGENSAEVRYYREK